MKTYWKTLRPDGRVFRLFFYWIVCVKIIVLITFPKVLNVLSTKDVIIFSYDIGMYLPILNLF